MASTDTRDQSASTQEGLLRDLMEVAASGQDGSGTGRRGSDGERCFSFFVLTVFFFLVDLEANEISLEIR